MEAFLGLLVVVGIIAIWAIRKHKHSSERNVESTDFQRRVRASDALDRVQAKYKYVVDKHFRLTEQIGVAYTVANNLNLPNSPEMDNVIKLCEQDIALAQSIKNWWDEQRATGFYDNHEIGRAYPDFSSFKRLAIIYEKRKEYDKAIEVCKRAIELGFTNDGTDGQMPGRIARLMKKQVSEKKIGTTETIEDEITE